MLKKYATLALLGLAFCCGAFADDDSVRIPTRFGDLKTNDAFELTYKDKVIKPKTLVFSPSRVQSTFKLESSDVILLSADTGAACPGRYVFLTVSADGAKVTPEFGTCYDDQVSPQLVGQSIAFSMKKLGGKGSVRYIYERGVVFENGTPVK
ncbi:MAG TPA: hypothetical protein VJ548_13355 [Azospira sp.]|nr:hypothetical protein [Azospira sp.]